MMYTADQLDRTLRNDPWQSVLADALHALVNALDTPDSGFTVDPWTLRPVTGGYAVSVHPECEKILSSVREGDLLEFLLRHGEVLESTGHAFGGWRDPADGRIYLDVSTIVDDLDEAIQLAKDHDQLAVWDFGGNRSIPTY